MTAVRNDVRGPGENNGGLTTWEKLLLVTIVACAILAGLALVGALR